MLATIFTIIVFCLGVGLVVLRSNPRRFPNQVFSANALFVSLWFCSVVQAMRAGESEHPIANLEPWLRVNASIGAFAPWLILLLNYAVAGDRSRRQAFRRSGPLLLLGIVFAAGCWTRAFIAPHGPLLSRGPAYVLITAGELVTCVGLVAHVYRSMQRQAGIRRVEMQYLTLNMAITYPLVILSNAIGNFLHLPQLKYAGFFAVLAAFGLGGWAVTLHRVYNAQQILVSLLQRIAMVAALVSTVFAVAESFRQWTTLPLDLTLSIAICSPFILWLDHRTRQWLDLSGERRQARLRAALIEAARTEPDAANLETEFERLIRKDADAAFACLVTERGENFACAAFELPKSSPAFAALVQENWATTESLERRRLGPAAVELRSVMERHSIALLVAVPAGSPAPSLLLAMGAKHSRWPYTYPEIQRLHSGAAFVDNMLVRSRLTSQQALKAKLEHLAMVSRGLAHDLKNLVTPISSYLVHTTGRHAPGSAEEEVHTAARRSVTIINDYVNEALFFAKRLTPKFEAVHLAQVLPEVLEITSVRARRRGVNVTISRDLAPAVEADAVLLQRLLVNLTGNAIDASSSGSHVVIAAHVNEAGRLVLDVADHGVGIDPEHTGRIFEPYFTTKNLGDDTRGFGLGLTICEKIVALHQGTIAVRSELGHGTCVTVELPLRQPVDGTRHPGWVSAPPPSSAGEPIAARDRHFE